MQYASSLHGPSLSLDRHKRHEEGSSIIYHLQMRKLYLEE